MKAIGPTTFPASAQALRYAGAAVGSVGAIMFLAVAVIALWPVVQAGAWSALGAVALFFLLGIILGALAWMTWTSPRRVRMQFGKDGVRLERPWRKTFEVPYASIANVGASPFGALRIRDNGAGTIHAFSLQWFSRDDAASIVAEFEARHIPVDRPMALATRAAYP